MNKTQKSREEYRKQLETAYNLAASIDDCSDVECLIRCAINMLVEKDQALSQREAEVREEILKSLKRKRFKWDSGDLWRYTTNENDWIVRWKDILFQLKNQDEK